MRRLLIFVVCFGNLYGMTESTPLQEASAIGRAIEGANAPELMPIGLVNMANVTASIIGFMVGVVNESPLLATGFGVSLGASAVHVMGYVATEEFVKRMIEKRHNTSINHKNSFDSNVSDDLRSRLSYTRNDNKIRLIGQFIAGCTVPLGVSGALLVSSAFYEDATKHQLQVGALSAGVVGGANGIALLACHLRTHNRAKRITSRIANLFGTQV